MKVRHARLNDAFCRPTRRWPKSLKSIPLLVEIDIAVLHDQARSEDIERKLEALALEPVGGQLTASDFFVLCLTGLLTPCLLLLWGWM